MKKFCEVMEDVLIPADKQAEALREASAAHSKQMASCAVCERDGVDEKKTNKKLTPKKIGWTRF